MDAMGVAKIKMLNQSSYNLRLNFEVAPYYEDDQYKNVDIRQNDSVSIEMLAFNYVCNPNDEVKKIIFSNLDTEEIIKEMVTDKNTFEKTGKARWKAYYLLEITDDLLDLNEN
jgi:hypothetical protein